MSDEIQIVEDIKVDEDVAAVAAPSIGACLSAAREQQSINIEDVARSLKIAVRQVEALESNDYTNLPGATFIKGFIRNYAKLLQIDPEPLIARLQDTMPGGAFQPIISPNERIEISTTGTKPWLWLVMLLMVVIVAVPLLIYEKLRSEVRPGTPAANTPVVTAPAVNEVVAPVAPVLPQAAVEASTGESADMQQAPAATENMAPVKQDAQPKQPPVPVKAEAATPPAVIGSGAGSVKMTFSKDAWVEIRDKTGNKIYSQLNRAGTEQVVQGNPPLSIVVGNAANVTVTYNGKPVDIAPYINVDVARLKLE